MSKRWSRGKRSAGPRRNNYENKNDASDIDNLPNYGYPGYTKYFRENSKINETTLARLECLLKYIENHKSNYSINDIIRERYYNLEYKLLVTDEDICSGWVDFKDDLVNDSEHCLKCLGLAMHTYIYRAKQMEEQEKESPEEIDIGTIYVRIMNFEPILKLKDLKVNYYGKLVTIRGTVIKAGHTKLHCQYLAFSCIICKGTQLVKQEDGNYTIPTSCATKGCRIQSNFVPLHKSHSNEIITWQSLKVQELLGTEMCEDARVPRTLDCELTEDMVKSCIPGDDITITGVIKVRDMQNNIGKNRQHTIFDIYLDAVSVFNNKKHCSSSGGPTEGIIFDTNDYYLIQEIHSEPNLFKTLVHSMCPHIYGHEVVKAGLLLALLGGTKTDTFRAESHVLVVGDPGLGKSQMLQACTNIAPRGVYVCGNTSTSSGLTVTITRDGSEYALEAGALMLADQGCCCIDEFDKMPTQHACLLEAMEQQNISIAKAGIVCNLPTRATILAAANPAGGHYDKSKTIAENLRIGSPMLSRFDLTFILLDRANEKLDNLLSKHVLGLHTNCPNGKMNISALNNTGSSDSNNLRERLRLGQDIINPIPHVLFRKYIAYAQKYVKPQLSEEARKLIKEFYLTLRKKFQTGDSTPITTRQLNSLIRLTQARAKAELREEATKADAADVIEIMNFSLIDIFTDDTGLLDKTRTQNCAGMSKRNQATRLLSIIQQKSDMETKAVFTIREIKDLSEQAGIDKEKVFDIVQSLNIQGFLLSKGQSRYQLVSATT